MKYLSHEEISTVRIGDSVLIHAPVTEIRNNVPFVQINELQVDESNLMWKIGLGPKSNVVELIKRPFIVGDIIVSIAAPDTASYTVLYIHEDTGEAVITPTEGSAFSGLFIVKSIFFKRKL